MGGRPDTRAAAAAGAMLLAAALPGAVEAQCGEPSATCVCGIFEAEGVLEGAILEAVEPVAIFEVQAVHGDAGGHTVGDRLPLEWRGGEVEGLRMLLNLRDGEVVFRQPVGAQGQVVCPGHGFQAPVEDAVAAVLSDDCAAAMRDLGLQPGDCAGAGAPGVGGCASAGHEGVALWAILAFGFALRPRPSRRTERLRRPGPACRPPAARWLFQGSALAPAPPARRRPSKVSP